MVDSQWYSSFRLKGPTFCSPRSDLISGINLHPWALQAGCTVVQFHPTEQSYVTRIKRKVTATLPGRRNYPLPPPRTPPPPRPSFQFGRTTDATGAISFSAHSAANCVQGESLIPPTFEPLNRNRLARSHCTGCPIYSCTWVGLSARFCVG